MKISQLEYFVEAARTTNYPKAAQNLYTSRQNVSHAVKALEEELGTKLFCQTSNSLSLTRDGRRAVRYAEAVLDDVAEFKSAFQPTGNPGTNLFILLGTNILTYTRYDIPHALREIGMTEYTLGELDCDDCYEKVVEGEADIAFIACMPRSFPGCDEILIHEDYLYLLVNAESDLAGKSGLTADDLIGNTLMAPPGFEFQMAPLVSALHMKLAPKGTITPISSFDYVERAIREQGFIGIASSAIKDSLPEGLAIRPLLDQGMRMGLRALCRNDSPRRKLCRSIIARTSASIRNA